MDREKQGLAMMSFIVEFVSAAQPQSGQVSPVADEIAFVGHTLYRWLSL